MASDMDLYKSNPLDDSGLTGADIASILSAVFTFPMNGTRDGILAEATAKWTLKSIEDAIMHVASKQSAEYHATTFERCLSRIVQWLQKNGEVLPLAPDEIKAIPGWWAHGMPISGKHGRKTLYGWMIADKTGERGYVAVYYIPHLLFNIIMGSPWDAVLVEDGPALPSEPKIPLCVRKALIKHPMPEVIPQDTEGWYSKVSRIFLIWHEKFMRCLESLPGEGNILQYRNYLHWKNQGYPLIPIGWESILDADKKEKTPF